MCVTLFAAQIETDLKDGIIFLFPGNGHVAIRTGNEVELRQFDSGEELDAVILVPRVHQLVASVSICVCFHSFIHS